MVAILTNRSNEEIDEGRGWEDLYSPRKKERIERVLVVTLSENEGWKVLVGRDFRKKWLHVEIR